MSAQPEQQHVAAEERSSRLSGPSSSPGAQPPVRTSVLHRVSVGVLLASLLGVALLHWTLVSRFAAQTEARAARAAMIAARAVADVATVQGAEGDGLRAAIARWQKEHRAVRAVRVVNVETRSFEASSFAEDLKEGEMPRQMQRPEKPLYDLGQELRANVEANVAEGRKHEEEVRVEQRPDGSFLIAAPVELEGVVVGFAQIHASPEGVAVEAPGVLYALAFALAPFAIVVALSLVLPRNMTLVVVAAVLLLVTIFAYRQFAVGSLVSGATEAERRFAERVQREASIVARVAPGAEAKAKTWDADEQRTPLRVDPAKAVEGEKNAIASASYGIGVLSLALLLFVALGAAQRTGRAFVQHRQAYSYVAPALVGMLLLVFFPFFYGIAISFTGQTIYNANDPLPEIWNGLQNYKEILGDFSIIKDGASGRVVNYENFYYTLFFTIVWTLANVTIGVTVGLMLALILNTKGLRGKTIYRVLLILPWAVPNYITALIWKGMFHRQFGVINHVFAMVGIEPVSWFEHPVTSFIAIVTTNGWLSFPFMMVVSLGALQSISADLYEAARVDGATAWQQFTSITLPSLKPALVPAVILSVVWTFNMFNIIYLVSAGDPAHSTEILITQAYKLAFEQYRYGYAAAYSTIIFAILLIYGVFQNRVSRGTEAIA